MAVICTKCGLTSRVRTFGARYICFREGCYAAGGLDVPVPADIAQQSALSAILQAQAAVNDSKKAAVLATTAAIAAEVKAAAAGESICQEADRIVSVDRQATYGHPREDFARTAKIWSAIIGKEITIDQVALCMIGVKISRLCHGYKRDSAVDVAGYAKTLDMCHDGS